ncbi:MAG: hypothetical protein HFH45_02085 [Bacilli bacterium]|nr:hypothetical protein [Bacilli bacterium]
MKDLHTHVMYGIDDGSRTIEESMTMLERLSNEGVTDVMLTPHYIENSKYNCNNKNKKQLFKKIKQEAQRRGININIYLGNEIMVNNNIMNLFNTEIATLNASKYLLIELPMEKEFDDLDLVIKELTSNGVIPIIAHPERYSYVKDNYKWLEEYLKMGVLFQSNYESLFGKYGKEAKKTIKKLLKHNMVHFLASDIHHESSKCNLKKLHKKLKRIIKSEDNINDLLNNNFTKVIKNEDINS